MAGPDKKSWRRFERIIAAIELATSQGATVVWDEQIDGRQFDVAVRFTNGPHQYLKVNMTFELFDCLQNVPVSAVGALDLPIGFNI